MRMMQTGNLDDVADALSRDVKRKKTGEPLNDLERELFREAFRAGATVMFHLSSNAAMQGPGEWHLMMQNIGVQVVAWGLPLVTEWRDEPGPRVQ